MNTKVANKKVLVAMSGGVDSSVAAVLLQQQGYDVVGCFMRLGNEDSFETDSQAQACTTLPQANKPQGCCSLEDASDGRLVAAKLGIPFYVMNFRKDFGRIIEYFVDEYNAGRTPNPCVRCNDWLKFGKLWDYARSIDADYVATGHYARVDHGDTPRLLRGLDESKDQSYVLFGTPKDHLLHMLLPVGGYQKSEIRKIAEQQGLPVFDKPDSQEICFVPDGDYGGLIERTTPHLVEEGDILDAQGNVVGRHAGQQHFTIGQRRGIGVATGSPVYVTEKDPNRNTITIGSRADLMADGLTADQTNWLIDPPDSGHSIHCRIKIRYNSEPQAGTVRCSGVDEIQVRFDEPQSAVTAGQAVVCYDGDAVICGGWIDQAISSDRGS